MSPRTVKQFENIRAKKMELIINTAMELFAKDGYYSTSISKIAKEAGISKGLMYNYFDSKEHLITSIINQGLEELLQYFDPNNDGTLSKDDLIYYIEQTINLFKEKAHFWKLYFSVMLQPTVFKIIENKLMEFVIPIFGILDNYFKSQNYADPEMETRFFTAMLDGVCMNYVMEPDHFPIDKIKDKIINMYK